MKLKLHDTILVQDSKGCVYPGVITKCIKERPMRSGVGAPEQYQVTTQNYVWMDGHTSDYVQHFVASDIVEKKVVIIKSMTCIKCSHPE